MISHLAGRTTNPLLHLGRATSWPTTDSNRVRISEESSSVIYSQTNFLRVIDMVARGVLAVGIRRTEEVAKACSVINLQE